MVMEEYFKILDLRPDAGPAELRQAYLRQVRRHHPDQFAGEPELRRQAEEMLKRINIAYGKIKAHRALNAPKNPDKPSAAKPKPRKTSSPAPPVSLIQKFSAGLNGLIDNFNRIDWQALLPKKTSPDDSRQFPEKNGPVRKEFKQVLEETLKTGGRAPVAKDRHTGQSRGMAPVSPLARRTSPGTGPVTAIKPVRKTEGIE